MVVADGIVDPHTYLSSSKKVLLVLKEVNSGESNWDLRDFLRKGGQKATWDSVTRWLIGIERLNEDLEWTAIQDITEEQRVDYLKVIGAINIKKSPGGYTTVIKKLDEQFKQDVNYLQRQLNLYMESEYKPNIILCGGTGDYIAPLISPQNTNWLMTRHGIRYIQYEPGCFLISFVHPEVRVAPQFIYYGLMDALKELFV